MAITNRFDHVLLLLTSLIVMMPVSAFAQGTVNRDNPKVVPQPTLEVQKLINQAIVHRNKNQWESTLKTLEEAFRLAQQTKDQSGEASVLTRIGIFYLETHKLLKALEFYQKALPIYRQIGDESGEGGTLTNIGAVYAAIGEPLKALEFYQKALPIHQRTGNKRFEANTLTNIGAVYTVMVL